MKKLLLLVVLISGHPVIFAQYSRYIIQLKDKAGTPFTTGNPAQFLTARSIERRIRYNIPIDPSDLPITPAYIDSIRIAGNVRIINVSKWLNQVCISTTDAAALNKISGYSFVLSAAPIAARKRLPPLQIDDVPVPITDQPATVAGRPLSPADVYNYGVAYQQVSLHNTQFLHNLGFKGEGMQLALMDAGFYHYNSLPVFDSMRNNNQVLGTWDFVANEAAVDEDNVHGMNCLSTIAANIPGSFVGTSPKSSFYLFRTEDVSGEYPVEEQNWAAAAEKADSLGVDVFSVSLGYNLFDNSIFDYTYSDMDGNTTLISRACDLAAKKGILVVVAAGNDGNSSWKYLNAPADADSVLTVGAVNASRQIAGFSSYGPSSDGQVKPDVAAIGLNAVIADQTTGSPTYGNGTSYACPIMAGVVSCLWQAFPEINNMAIIEALRRSSDRQNTPDDRTGYGIPDVKKAFVSLIRQSYSQQAAIVDTCKSLIAFTVKKAAGMNVVLDRKLPAETEYTALTTFNFTGSFATGGFNYTDDLSAIAGGVSIKYRLKMNIASDTSFFLDSVTLNYSGSCGTVAEVIGFRPNPVTDQLNVRIPGSGSVKATVVVHSTSGQKVYSNSQQLNGIRSMMVPMKQLSHGVYFVTVFLDDRKVIVKKIIRE